MLCIASGPSLTAEDIESCRGRVDGAIAVNDSYRLCPWATALWGCDSKWWQWNKGAPDFEGLKYSLQAESAKWPGVQVLKNTGTEGIELDPHGVRTGKNGGYQAINAAIHMGATRILLLGYDMQRTNGKAHFFGEHPVRTASPLQSFIPHFEKLPPLIEKLGVSVINCTRETALECFPKMTIEEALMERAA